MNLGVNSEDEDFPDGPTRVEVFFPEDGCLMEVGLLQGVPASAGASGLRHCPGRVRDRYRVTARQQIPAARACTDQLSVGRAFRTLRTTLIVSLPATSGVVVGFASGKLSAVGLIRSRKVIWAVATSATPNAIVTNARPTRLRLHR